MNYRQQIIHHLQTGTANQSALEGLFAGKKSVISYAQLTSIISDIDRSFISQSQIIGVFSNRSLEAYIGVLSAFYGGKTFVPLNPKFSDKKLGRIIELSGVDLILHSAVENDRSILTMQKSINLSEVVSLDMDNHSHTRLTPAPVRDDDIVYHMFTSGSTGDPKGVPISHKNLGHYVSGISQLIPYSKNERFSQVFDLSFDLSMHDIFVCFFNNGTLVAASDMDLMLPAHYIKRKSIDHWFSVPVLADAAIKSHKNGTEANTLKTALFCGEALPLKTAQDFMNIFVQSDTVWNLYGPTEATIAFSAKQISKVNQSIDIAPLGRGFGINVLAIEKPDGEIKIDFQDGDEGQLLLAGDQVFSGYSPQVNSDVFVNLDDVSYYRSGDLVRFSNSELLYLGRIDHQVKIRGHRVELSEIEVTFRKTYNIEMVAAYTTGNIGDLKVNLAYQSDEDIEDVNRLKDWLPDYMIPETITRFKKLPLNSNGKIDRKALIAGS